MFYSLSIIVTLHKEGVIAFRTLENIFEIIKYSKENNCWASIEVIAVLDNADVKTYEAIGKLEKYINKVENVNFGDPSLSRNYGASIATGDFIFFADGDDYFSLNALQAIYSIMFNHYQNSEVSKSSDSIDYLQHIAVFPEFYIEFPRIYVQKFVDSNIYIKQNMMFHHAYVARICILRSIILQNLIRQNDGGYGFEDWDLNNRLLSLGMQFKIAPGFEVYYRRKTINSVLTHHLENKCIVRYSELYEQARSDELQTHEQVKAIQPLKSYQLFPTRLINYLLRYYPRKLKKGYYKYADFLIKHGESKLEVNKHISGDYAIFAGKVFKESDCFFELREFLRGADLVFFIPWLKLGGADRVIVEYTRILSEHGVNIKIVTNIEPGERINKINCTYFDIGKNNLKWANLTEDNQLHVLLKAIIASKVRALHIVNSEPMLKLIKYYDFVLSQYKIKYVITFFGLDRDSNNMKDYIGFPVWYKEIYNGANTVIGDNSFWYSEYKKINDNKDFNYVKLFSPISENTTYKIRKAKKTTNKILWASRICEQKLFGVFAKIITAMPDKHFVIYGGEPDNEKNRITLSNIIKLPNVEFRGVYHDLSELNLDEFDMYLYTSLFDGIPTILLDMLNCFLPVICSQVGGIIEVVGSDYELLVKNPLSVEGYVVIINKFYANINRYGEVTANIRARMLVLHNYADFKDKYLKVINNILTNNVLNHVCK